MGCWNATCMISGLPICRGDEIVAFVLLQNINAEWGSECYCHAEAKLVSHPIFGKYNDYGGIEDIVECEENDKLYEFLKEKMVASEGNDLGVDTDNKYHHFKEYSNLEQALNDNIERGYAAFSVRKIVNCLGGCTATNVKAPLTLTFIHRKIWDHVLSYGDHVTYTGKSMRDMLFDRYEERNKNTFRTPLCRPLNLVSANAMSDSWVGMDLEQMSMDTQMNICIFLAYLGSVRMHLRPTTGKGSQTDNTELHIALAKKTIEFAEEKLKQLDDE